MDTMEMEYKVELIQDTPDKWAIMINISETSESFYISTAKNEIRFFKDPRTAIELTKKYSKKFQKLKLLLVPEEAII